jgi:hypothetical protein
MPILGYIARMRTTVLQIEGVPTAVDEEVRGSVKATLVMVVALAMKLFVLPFILEMVTGCRRARWPAFSRARVGMFFVVLLVPARPGLALPFL